MSEEQLIFLSDHSTFQQNFIIYLKIVFNNVYLGDLPYVRL